MFESSDVAAVNVYEVDASAIRAGEYQRVPLIHAEDNVVAELRVGRVVAAYQSAVCFIDFYTFIIYGEPYYSLAVGQSCRNFVQGAEWRRGNVFGSDVYKDFTIV